MNETDVKTIGECIDHILHEDSWDGTICWKKSSTYRQLSTLLVLKR